MPLPPPVPSNETVARTAEYEVTTELRGAFLLVALRGRFTDDLLTVLQKQVFLQMRSMAVDASALSGMTMALARAVFYTAQGLRSPGHALRLIHPSHSPRG